MVKGINRTVIEINDTGNNMFEKIIFFVTPEYGNISSRQLKVEAQKVIDKYYPDMSECNRIRNIYRRKRLIRMVCAAVGLLVCLGVAALLVF